MNTLATAPRAKLPNRQPPRMFSPTRSLLTVGVSFLTMRTARKLRDGKDAVPAQERTFARLCAQLASTVYGRLHGIEARMTYTQFQARVPLQTYEGFIPHIERMKAGEPNVLWPGHCSFYAVSSGTTAGRTKYLPITEGMLEHFRKAGLDSLLYYTARVGHTGVFRGKHLFLGGSTTLTQLEESKNQAAYAGDLSGITALNLPGWVEKHLYEPGKSIAQVADWPTKLQAIAERTWTDDATTEAVAKLLEKMGIMGKGALLISEGAKPVLLKSTRNIPKVDVAERRSLNAGIVLTHANLVFAKPALDALVKELA